MEEEPLFPRLPVSHPLVHPAPAPAPVEAPAPPAPAPAPAAAPAPAPAPPAPAPAPAQGQGNAPPAGVMMGPNPDARLGVRIAQALLAAAALAAVASARDFASVTAFRYLISAAAAQCIWSLALSILYFYALLVGRSYRTTRAIAIICVGDWSLQITASLIFSAACASAGITTFINNDMEACYENHCPTFMAATAMAFLSWFSIAPCCILNLGSVVHKLQKP